MYRIYTKYKNIKKRYEVKKIEETINKYIVKVETGDTAGIKDYQFTKVVLENDKEIEVDNIVQVDVLKQVPEMNVYKLEENIAESKFKIELGFLDTDKAITDLTYEIKNEEEAVIQSGRLESANNNIELIGEENKKYKLYVYMNYNLDSNMIETEENYEGYITYDKELKFVTDYQFTISNIKTYKLETESKEFEKNEKIKIRFDSTNVTECYPEKIKINGTEYEVNKTQNENLYETEISCYKDSGKKIINIEELTLNN